MKRNRADHAPSWGLVTATLIVLAGVASSSPISIYDREYSDLIADQDGVFTTYTYERDYCALPIKVGISFSKMVEPPVEHFSMLDKMILTEKIVDIPGAGVITAFECLVNNASVPAKMGVVTQYSPGRYMIKCITEAKGSSHLPLLMDFIVLEQPCYVEEGDYIAYFQKQGPNRCIFSNLSDTGADARVTHIAYNEVRVGDTLPFVDQVLDEVPLFTALFECDCSEKAIGSLLADRPRNDQEIFEYVDQQNVVPAQSYVGGLAIYSESLVDDSVEIELISKATGNQLCGEKFSITESKIGIIEEAYSTPCFLTEDAYVRVAKTSVGPDTQDARLSYSENASMNCLLIIGGSVQNNCDRQYSVAALLTCPKSFQIIDNKVRLPKLTEDILASPPYAECYDDYQYEFKSWNSTTYHELDRFGPTVYIDTKHPLKRGILARWEHHSSEAHEEDFFFPAIFRLVNETRQIYKIVCWAYQSNKFDAHWRVTYPSENCTVKDDDYVGFLYVGQEKVPVSVAKMEVGIMGFGAYKTITEDSLYLSVSIPEKLAEYSFAQANIDVKFNIHAVVCYVGFEPYFNDTFTIDDPEASGEQNITNMIVDRENQNTDAFILIDFLNPVPATGIVHAFTAYVKECDEYSVLMMMVRPNDQGSHDVICDRYVDGCNYYVNYTFPVEEQCIVEEGDLLAVSSLDNGDLPVPYHIVDDYPCSFANLLIQITDEECERKYSIGYIYERICLVSKLGNRIIDRPYTVLQDSGPGTVYTYVDAYTPLENGIVAAYEVYVEAPFTKIEFMVVDYEINKDLDSLIVVCREEMSFTQTMKGMVKHLATQECAIDSGHRLAVKVHGGGQSFGISCDPSFGSDIKAQNQQSALTSIAEECRLNARMSLNILMQCDDDIETVQEVVVDNNESTTKEYETAKNVEPNYCPVSSLKTITGHTIANGNLISKGKMLYMDKSLELDDGFLNEWTITVKNPNSPLVPVIWRHVSYDQYAIVCYGYTDDTSKSIDAEEIVYPEGVCKTKKGDHVGFLSLAADDETMRIAGETDTTTDCYLFPEEEIDGMNFLLNAVVTMEWERCNPRRKYPINAIICSTLEKSECLDRRISVSGIDPSVNCAYQSDSPVAHVNVNETIPQGDLISWEIDVTDPSSPIYPVVWKKLNSTSYRIACTTIENDFHSDEGIVSIIPRERCFIDSDDYHVGFIDRVSGSRISYSDAFDENFGMTMMDLPEFDIIEGQVVHIHPLNGHPLLAEYVELDTIPSYADERLYNIRAKICSLGEICDGDHTIVATSDQIFDQVVVSHAVSPRLITKVRIMLSGANVNVQFGLMFFGRDKDGLVHLIHNESIEAPNNFSVFTVDFDPPISLGYPINYIALNLSDTTPPDVQTNPTLVNPVQLVVPSCVYISPDLPFPFTTPEIPVGTFPLSFCSKQEQVIGDWSPYFEGDRLKFVYKGSPEYFVVTSDNLKTFILPNGVISDFSALLFEPGPVTFAIMENVSYSAATGKHTFQIVQTRTFTATRSGVITWSATNDPIKDIKPGSFLAVIMRKPIVPVTYVDETINEFGYVGSAASDYGVPGTVELEYAPIKPFIQGRLRIQMD